jgi:hypothetical protein
VAARARREQEADVKLISTDGLALIGRGSEWFWTALSGLILAVTFIAIYRQMRLQRAATLFDQLATIEREWAGETFVRENLQFLLDMRDAKAASGLPRSAAPIGNWFERLGYLAGRGDLRLDDVWHVMRRTVAFYWAIFAPYVAASRAEYGTSALFEWFERLEMDLRAVDRKRTGRSLELGPDDVARELPGTIAGMALKLRMAQESRASIAVASPVGRAIADAA